MTALTITDRDLLVIEPSVFIDAAAAAATPLVTFTDGMVSGSELTTEAADFVAADIDAGHVLRVDYGGGIVRAVEVVGRIGADALEVSLPRVLTEDDAIEPGDGTELSVTAPTFARIIAQARQWALAALGIDPNHPIRPLDADSILNPDLVGQMIALRSILMAFDIAAAVQPDNASLAARATLYVRRASQVARQIAALIDLDDDGLPDTTRRIDTIVFVRN